MSPRSPGLSHDLICKTAPALRTRQGRVHRLDHGREPQHPRAPRRSTPSTISRCSPAISAAPGASPFSITGQCNAMGTREAGFTSSLPGYRKFESMKDREELAALWGIARRAHSDRARLGLSGHHRSRVLAKKIRALWIIATNPMVSFPNHRRAEAGAGEPRFPGRAGWLSSDAHHRTRRPGSARGHLGRKGRHLHQLRAPRQQGESRGRPAGRSR